MTTRNQVEVTESWTLVYDAEIDGQFIGRAYCSTNDQPIYRISTSLPLDNNAGITASVFDVQLSALRGEKLYARAYDGSAQIILDRATGRSGWPIGLVTSEKEKYGRIRVDSAQTGFFEGREFRTFKEINIASGDTLVVQINAGVNTILLGVKLVLDAGSIKLRTVAGGTLSGTFNDSLPIIPKNTMTGGLFPAPPEPLYVSQNTISSGGTALSGGIDIDVLRVVSANANAQAQSVGQSENDMRGVGAGTYYWVFENFGNGAATGVFSAFWEEQPFTGGLDPETFLTPDTEMSDYG